MKVRDINNGMIGRAVILVEADDFPVYNGMVGWIETHEKYGLIFTPAPNRMPHPGKSMNVIPLKPDDLIEFIEL